MPTLPDLAPLSALLDTLALIVAQARSSQSALPAEQVQARLALAVLERLAQQAANEARDLLTQLEPGSQTGHPLTAREVQVLRLASDGLTNKEIAYRLGLSERTVQFHLSSVYSKTGTNSRAEATAVAFRRGWL
jgi:DNA-binding NarL/FixJ family response regulator